MLSNQVVDKSYQGDGATQDFSITPDIIVNDSNEISVYLRDETIPTAVTETLLTEGALQDYTLTGATPPSQPFDDTVHMNVAPTATQIILIVRTLPLTQTLDLDPNSVFPANSTETNLDRIVAMIQQVNNKFKRVLRLTSLANPDFPDGVDVPDAEAGSLLAWNATGDALENISPAALAASSGGLPVSGDQYSLLEKASSTDGDAGWTDPLVYQGYSERYNELVDLEGIKAVADYIMDMGYAPPTISLGTSPSYSTIRERGDTIASVDLTATIGLVLDAIATVRFYRGVTLLDTQVAGGAIPSGGSSVYTDATPFSTTTSYSAQVDDDSAQAKPSATSATRTFTFVYPYYYGVGAASLGTGVSGLTKQIITETTNTTRNFTVNGSQKMYFAYPASYGTLSSILDVNSFNTVGDWTLTVANITGLDGNPVSYNIYEFNNFAVAGTFQYTFIQ